MNCLGRHLLVEFYGGSTAVLNDVLQIETSMLQAAQSAGATIITSQFHHFPPLGVSGFIVLQESHFAIHTWPEHGYAALDLFTCGFSVNPWIAYDFLKQAFQAQHGSALELNRGQLHLLETPKRDLQQPEKVTPLASTDPQEQRLVWFSDRNDNIALSIRHKGSGVFREQSPYQTVEILDTFEYGKMLVLDNIIMCSEKDEKAYHEMLVHVPLLTHTAANILVIGGGDGGSVREIFRHSQVEQVTLVEIDEVVVKAAKSHLPSLSVALDHPKLQLVIGDGIDYVTAAASQTYDLILIDSSDPVGHSAALFTPAFYQQVHRILKTGGVMVAQSGSPQLNQPQFRNLYGNLYRIFGTSQVHCYLAFIATYPTGMWSFAYCSKAGPHPLRDFDLQAAQQFVQDQPLAYYNPGMHQAAFCLPTFVSKMLTVDTAAIFVES
ncbi:MAG: polyamine aminopropyltransferase [Acaryochloris sp. RU_4_1]|nr:polyamine aminopropyltransferase [Acaryochloris sp. SU_5_25]NJM67668.1 polyamine aminopropyltransferase [Acaryochloris sp. RU_4_1]NJR56400.1 polyamine aminopropyltransferase [Acaryochloris sp. CRU_2_0]